MHYLEGRQQDIKPMVTARNTSAATYLTEMKRKSELSNELVTGWTKVYKGEVIRGTNHCQV